MRAAAYYAPDQLRLEERPMPAPGPGELLVRVSGCGLCGSDLAKIVHRSVPDATILGHEVVGRIAAVGPGGATTAGGIRLAEGERVVVGHHVPCFACHYCKHGSVSQCRTFKTLNLDPGGLAEYVRVPARNAAYATFPVPPALADAEAAFTEPLACCLRAVKRSGLLLGDSVVVVGLGSIGLLLVQLARHFRAAVVGSDPVAARRRLALELGAGAAVDPADGSVVEAARAVSGGRGADVVILTVTAGSVLADALAAVRDGGTVVVFAGPEPSAVVPLDLRQVYHREVTLLPSYSPSPVELEEALGLIADGAVRVSPLVSHRVPLAAAAEGVRLALTREALKVFVEIGGGAPAGGAAGAVAPGAGSTTAEEEEG